jgi:hypothetical protein
VIRYTYFSWYLASNYSYNYFSYSLSHILVYCSIYFLFSFMPNDCLLLKRISWLVVMGIGIFTFIMIAVVFLQSPSPAVSSLRSWFCGTCAVCSVCPSCEPQLNVSPICECNAAPDYCTCNCITHENLQTSLAQLNLPRLINMNHATQLTSLQQKHTMLFGLLGLSLLIAIIAIATCVFLIGPCLRLRLSSWHQRRRAQHRNKLMKKFQLVEAPLTSNVATDKNGVSSMVSVISGSPITPAFTYAQLLQELDAQKQLVRTLSHELTLQLQKQPNPSLANSFTIS